MDSYFIQGSEKLSGCVKIEGSKNAALPILVALLLNGDSNTIYNCPKLRDVAVTLNILELMGCSVHREDDILKVNTSNIKTCEIPDGLVREMRSSIIILGAMLARMGKTVLSYPGGCEIGTRPIDLHVKGLRALGAKITESGGYLHCEAEKMIGTEINLDLPSVGATENIMLAAVAAEGITTIRNAAREPEIVDLQGFLNAIGCKISGAGTNIIKVEGVKKFKKAEYAIIPDRIVAGTYLAFAAATQSNMKIVDVIPEHMSAIIFKLQEAGCNLKIEKDSIEIDTPKRIKSFDSIKTQPYPGFPTDLQAQASALASIAEGTSVITENIFENRFKHIGELAKMGAKTTVEGRTAVIEGVKKLHGANVEAKDLRGGAALVLAGLAAEGKTVINGIHHIERGYEELDEKLRALGAKIYKG